MRWQSTLFVAVECCELAADTHDMAQGHRQRRSIGRELRDLVFRVCTVGGGFLGLLYALGHYRAATGPDTTVQCRGHVGRAHTTAGCIHAISSTFTSDALALILPVFIGLLLGACVGYLIVLTTRTDGKPRPIR
jgi:hypothetical protein